MELATPSELPDRRRWNALGVCVTALFMTPLDVSIVNVALPSIGVSAGAGACQLQWIVSGYALAFGMVPIIGGRLGDDRGRKPMLLFGIAAFVVTSAMGGWHPIRRSSSPAGTAVLGAVFYAAAAAALQQHGERRYVQFGHAYAVSLAVSVVFALAALSLALRDVRHGRTLRPSKADPRQQPQIPGAELD